MDSTNPAGPGDSSSHQNRVLDTASSKKRTTGPGVSWRYDDGFRSLGTPWVFD